MTTYSILLGGEGGTSYVVQGWQGITAEGASNVLSTVTGFRPDFLREELGKAMQTSELRVWKIRPAACNFGETPHFLVSEDNPAPRA